MTLPMSFLEAAPVSAMASSPSLTRSASLMAAGEVFFQDGDFSRLVVGQVSAAGGLELGDGVLALFDFAADDDERIGVVQVGIGTVFFDRGVLDGGLEGADDVEGDGVLGPHGGLHVFGDACGDLAHKRDVFDGEGRSIKVLVRGS